MVTEYFIDTFGDFFNDHPLLLRLVKSTFQAVQNSLSEKKERITNSILSTLSVPVNLKEVFVKRYLNKIFQEYALNIFEFTEAHAALICSKLSDTSQTVKNWLKLHEFKKFLSVLHKLYLHMELSEPKIDIEINIEKSKYDKELYHCLDGFPKEGMDCIVIVPAPKRQGQIYQNIKSAVIIVNSMINAKEDVVKKPFKDNLNIKNCVGRALTENTNDKEIDIKQSESKYSNLHSYKETLKSNLGKMGLTMKVERPENDLIFTSFDNKGESGLKTVDCIGNKEPFTFTGDNMRQGVHQMWDDKAKESSSKISGLRESMKLYRNKLGDDCKNLNIQHNKLCEPRESLTERHDLSIKPRDEKKINLREDVEKPINKKLIQFKKAVGLDKSHFLHPTKHLFTTKKCTFLK